MESPYSWATALGGSPPQLRGEYSAMPSSVRAVGGDGEKLRGHRKDDQSFKIYHNRHNEDEVSMGDSSRGRREVSSTLRSRGIAHDDEVSMNDSNRGKRGEETRQVSHSQAAGGTISVFKSYQDTSKSEGSGKRGADISAAVAGGSKERIGHPSPLLAEHPQLLQYHRSKSLSPEQASKQQDGCHISSDHERNNEPCCHSPRTLLGPPLNTPSPKNPLYSFMPEGKSPSSTPSSVSPSIKSPSLKLIRIEDIEVGEFIGEGSFGAVRKGSWRGMEVALKALHSERNRYSSHMSHAAVEDSLILGQDCLQEVQTMALVCNHANIVQLVGVVYDVSAFSPCIVSVYYANGSVFDKLFSPKASGTNGNKDISTAQLVQWALETAKGVDHLHKENVIHRDLATRNLLLDDLMHIRVADFGFSRIKEEGVSKGFTRSDLGPVKWTAPEAMRRKQYSTQSDVFSFGVVLYELFVQRPPWEGLEAVEVVIQVCAGSRMDIPSSVPPLISSLMSRCWEQSPGDRPSFSAMVDLLHHQDQSSSNATEMNCPQLSKFLLSCHNKVHQEDATFYYRLFSRQEQHPEEVAEEMSHRIPLLRVVYILLRMHGRSNQSVDLILELLKKWQGKEFHLTLSYFSIQVVTYCITWADSRPSVDIDVDSWENVDSFVRCPENEVRKKSKPLLFSSFMKFCATDGDRLLNINDEMLHFKYYSDEQLRKGKYVFVLPNLHALPSLMER